MHSKHLRALIGSIVLSSCALGLGISSVAAATCVVAGPSSVAIGTALSIEGTGFPASTGVNVSITIDGGPPDEFTAQSDAGGTFKIDLTPEASEAGTWIVLATAGAACQSQLVIAVGVPAATPQPSNNTVAASGADGSPPRTDAASALTGTTDHGSAIWLALVLLVLGAVGRTLTKPIRSR